MKVLHVVNQLTIGGIETFIYRLAKASEEDITVFTYKDGVVHEWLSDASIRVCLGSLIKLLENEPFDIVVMHIGSSMPDEYKEARKKFPNIKFVTVLHTLYPIPDQTVDKIVCISESVYDVQAVKDKCIVIRPGIEINNDWFGCPVVGNVTRIAPYKMIKESIIICKNVSSTIPDIKFIFVGGDANDAKGYTEEMKAFAKEIGVENNVIFTGYVDNVEEYYKYFDIFLHPVGREAYPAVLWEALSHKIPIITTVFAQEIIKHGINGYLTSNTAEISEIIRRLIISRNLGLNENVKHIMDIKDTAKEFSKLYGELCTQS